MDDMSRLRKKERQNPADNWMAKLDVRQQFQGGKLGAYIDTSAGFTYADKVRCANSLRQNVAKRDS